MEQTVLNPVEIIAYAGLERNRQRRAKSRCVIRLDFESGRGLLCDTPRLYIEAGFDQLPMLYTQKHLLRAIRPKSEDDPHRHGLSVAQLKRLPELLAHPVMLCDSPAREDTLLALLRAVDCDNLPIIAAIRPNGPGYYELREIETNFIVTVYGKNNFSRYFDNLITPDKVIYYNEERGRDLNALAKLQLLRSHVVDSGLCNIIIRRPQCIVNMESKDSAAYGLNTETKDAWQASEELGSMGDAGRVQDKGER